MDGDHPILRAASTQLTEWFNGQRTRFDLSIAHAGTPFQETVWQALRDMFAECGEVQRADIITDFYGRSRGFGTVRFGTTEAANAAIEKFNDTEIDGRQISVRLDKYA